jgi:hypothetical protein
MSRTLAFRFWQLGTLLASTVAFFGLPSTASATAQKFSSNDEQHGTQSIPKRIERLRGRIEQIGAAHELKRSRFAQWFNFPNFRPMPVPPPVGGPLPGQYPAPFPGPPMPGAVPGPYPGPVPGFPPNVMPAPPIPPPYWRNF